jgi:hypothetical protein
MKERISDISLSIVVFLLKAIFLLIFFSYLAIYILINLAPKVYKDLKEMYYEALIKRRIATKDYPYCEARYSDIWEYIYETYSASKIQKRH